MGLIIQFVFVVLAYVLLFAFAAAGIWAWLRDHVKGF